MRSVLETDALGSSPYLTRKPVSAQRERGGERMLFGTRCRDRWWREREPERENEQGRCDGGGEIIIRARVFKNKGVIRVKFYKEIKGREHKEAVDVAEKAMAPHSSTLAWRIPGKGEPGGQPSMGLHRVGHD